MMRKRNRGRGMRGKKNPNSPFPDRWWNYSDALLPGGQWGPTGLAFGEQFDSRSHCCFPCHAARACCVSCSESPSPLHKRSPGPCLEMKCLWQLGMLCLAVPRTPFTSKLAGGVSWWDVAIVWYNAVSCHTKGAVPKGFCSRASIRIRFSGKKQALLCFYL